MNGSERIALGKFGEEIVRNYLHSKNCRVVCQRYHSRYGEIDLIAEDTIYLAFVEVKLRKNDFFGPARAYVDFRKQKKIITTAQAYLLEHPTELQPRFDVAEVYAPYGIKTKYPRIEYLKNAF